MLDVWALIMNTYKLMERMQLKLSKVVGSTIYNLGVASKTRIFLGHFLPASQESLASEECQVTYDVPPFSSEDEINSPLVNVNNNLYITAI